MPRGYRHPPEVRAEVERLYAERVLTLKEISETTGVSMGTIRVWLYDPDRSRQRALKESYRGECMDCGAPTDGSGGPHNAAKRCNPCNRAHQHDRRIWTEQTVVEAIRAFADKYGRQPTAADFLTGPHITEGQRERFYRDGTYPFTSEVLRECGTWNEALRLAGFEPLREFSRPLAHDPTVIDRAAAMYRDGASLEEVAEAFGVSDTRVCQWFDKAGLQRRTPWETRRLREAA